MKCPVAQAAWGCTCSVSRGIGLWKRHWCVGWCPSWSLLHEMDGGLQPMRLSLSCYLSPFCCCNNTHSREGNLQRAKASGFVFWRLLNFKPRQLESWYLTHLLSTLKVIISLSCPLEDRVLLTQSPPNAPHFGTVTLGIKCQSGSWGCQDLGHTGDKAWSHRDTSAFWLWVAVEHCPPSFRKDNC